MPYFLSSAWATERHSHVQEVRLTAEEREIRHETVRRGSSERVRRDPAEGGCRRTGVDRRRRSRAGGKRSRTFAGISSRKVGRRKRTPPVPKILDGEAEARVIAMYEGQQGYANWSLRLLAGKVVELGIADSISHETVRRTLKKTAFPAKGQSSTGYPEAEFVAEQVLEI